MHHRSRRFQKSGLSNVMAGFLALNGMENVCLEFRIVCPGPQSSIKVVLHLAEEAGTNLAVRSEPHPAARSAECLADGCDDADFADPIAKGIAPRRLARLPRGQLDQ